MAGKVNRTSLSTARPQLQRSIQEPCCSYAGAKKNQETNAVDFHATHATISFEA